MVVINVLVWNKIGIGEFRKINDSSKNNFRFLIRKKKRIIDNINKDKKQSCKH